MSWERGCMSVYVHVYVSILLPLIFSECRALCVLSTLSCRMAFARLVGNVRNRFSCLLLLLFGSCSCFLWCGEHTLLSFLFLKQYVLALVWAKHKSALMPQALDWRRGVYTCILHQKNIFNNGAICFGSFASIVVHFETRENNGSSSEKKLRFFAAQL